MYGFIIGVLLCYNVAVSFVAFLLYKKVRKRVSKSEIEDFILDNFLDLDL